MDILQSFSEEVIYLWDILARIVMNGIFGFILLHFIYRRFNDNDRFVFNLYVFNFIIFGLTSVLTNIELSVGSGFGLFSIFTMMRYRSEQINSKDMAYLLLMIGLGIFNSSGHKVVGTPGVIMLNGLLAAVIYVLEIFYTKHVKGYQKIKYDNIELLKPKYRQLLIRDLSLRLGKEVRDVKIDNVNFIDGQASLQVALGVDSELSDTDNLSSILARHKEEMTKIFGQTGIKPSDN